MAEPFLGELKIFGGNFAPRGWMFCAGQLLSIAENDALYSLVGTTYGGDGRVSFALPDLRGRAAVHQGSGYAMGQSAGSETVTLTPAQLPAHTHNVGATSQGQSSSSPEGNLLAATAGAGQVFYGPPGNLAALAPQSVGTAGGSQPHDNMQPSLVVNYIIAVEGIFPSQG